MGEEILKTLIVCGTIAFLGCLVLSGIAIFKKRKDDDDE